MPRPTLAQIQQAADDWNAKHPIGTRVRRYALMNPRHDPAGEHFTRSLASVTGEHSPVVFLTGFSGSVHLDSLEVLPAESSAIPAAEEVRSNIRAPFTNDQQDKLRSWQNCAWVHQLTCSQCNNTEPLTVEERGLVCSQCGHVQDWAPAAVMDGPMPNPTEMLKQTRTARRAGAFFASDVSDAADAVFKASDEHGDSGQFIEAVIAELQTRLRS